MFTSSYSASVICTLAGTNTEEGSLTELLYAPLICSFNSFRLSQYVPRLRVCSSFCSDSQWCAKLETSLRTASNDWFAILASVLTVLINCSSASSLTLVSRRFERLVVIRSEERRVGKEC